MIKNLYVKFIFIGFLNTCLGFSIFFFLLFVEVNYNVALLIEYLCILILSYLLNKNYTFQFLNNNLILFKNYLILFILSYLINLLLLNILLFLFDISPVVSQVICLFLCSPLSFIIQRNYIFKI